MQIDISEIIDNCINKLYLEDVYYDEIYNVAYNACEEIIADITSGIVYELEQRNIEINY